MTDLIDVIYYLYNDKITINDTIQMKKHKKVYINNKNFNDSLDLIPSNVKELTIDADNFICYNIPKHIYHLHIINLNNLIIIPSSVTELELGHKYLKMYPDILGLLSYNIKKITLDFPHYDNNPTINLNCLPDSIIYLNLFFWLCDSYFDIKLYKSYPNLKYINFYDAKLSNLKEIESYTINNNIDTKWLKLNNYLLNVYY
jgi:hypothetical protein